MLITVTLSSMAFLEAASAAAPRAVDAFIHVCAASPTMQAMEAAAKEQGWTREVYPADIRAGFLAELARQSTHSMSVSYSEIYSRQVAEGQAFIIASRTEPLFEAKFPAMHFCQLRVFRYKGNAPREAMSKELGGQPTEPWRDEHGNEVFNWFASKRFAAWQIQMSKTVSKTPLAGPADLAGLAILAEFSEKK